MKNSIVESRCVRVYVRVCVYVLARARVLARACACAYVCARVCILVHTNQNVWWQQSCIFTHLALSFGVNLWNTQPPVEITSHNFCMIFTNKYINRRQKRHIPVPWALDEYSLKYVFLYFVGKTRYVIVTSSWRHDDISWHQPSPISWNFKA